MYTTSEQERYVWSALLKIKINCEFLSLIFIIVVIIDITHAQHSIIIILVFPSFFGHHIQFHITYTYWHAIRCDVSPVAALLLLLPPPSFDSNGVVVGFFSVLLFLILLYVLLRKYLYTYIFVCKMVLYGVVFVCCIFAQWICVYPSLYGMSPWAWSEYTHFTFVCERIILVSEMAFFMGNVNLVSYFFFYFASLAFVLELIPLSVLLQAITGWCPIQETLKNVRRL